MIEGCLDRSEAMFKMNALGAQNKPFLFFTDWKGLRSYIFLLEEDHGILFDIRGKLNSQGDKSSAELLLRREELFLQSSPITLKEYKNGFEKVLRSIKQGDSYLVNLTYPTPLSSNLSLRSIYDLSRASYKIHVPGWFTVFSPESFVRIHQGRISTFPMKGTINAAIPDAKFLLLSNHKELAEHSTIVDLMRNDLSLVAKKVQVDRLRYIEKIEAFPQDLYQMSSEISGILPDNYQSHLGDILYSLLPAGSISGAPKKRTVEIIERAEIDDRNWYTGIFGIFDGHRLDTAVMIRYIEESENGLVYRSGGGITSQSEMEKEYQELIDKVYVPFSRDDSNIRRPNYQPHLA